MKILVTFAVGAEFAAWRRLRRFERMAQQPKPVYAAHVAGTQVRVVLTGIGGHAVEHSRDLLRESAPDVCIAAGFAGGLREEYRTGDVLAARVVRGSATGRILESDRNLLELAVEAGARAVGCFVTSDRVLCRAEEKLPLSAGADAVDMESYFVLDEMRALGVPTLALRAVADTVEESLPLDFNRALTPDGRMRLGPVLAELLGSPQRLPGLFRLHAEVRRAASGLARFLEAYIPSLAQANRPSEIYSEVAAR